MSFDSESLAEQGNVCSRRAHAQRGSRRQLRPAAGLGDLLVAREGPAQRTILARRRLQRRDPLPQISVRFGPCKFDASIVALTVYAPASDDRCGIAIDAMLGRGIGDDLVSKSCVVGRKPIGAKALRTGRLKRLANDGAITGAY